MPAPAAPQPTTPLLARTLHLLFLAAGAALLVFVLLTALYLRQGLLRGMAEQGGEVAIRASIPAETAAARLRDFEQKFRRAFPRTDTVILDTAAVRALLAMQEPWIATLPDLEVRDVPRLFEVRVPVAWTDAAPLEAILQHLHDAPEIEFVLFTSTGLDDIAAASRKLRRYANAGTALVCASAALFFLLLAAASGRAAGRPPVASVILGAVAAGVGGVVAGILIFHRMAHLLAARAGELPPLPPALLSAAGLCVLILLILGELVRAALWPARAR